ncbi:hypothetical protein R3P38DRAFT_2826280 [Favolaschia claudopus]|uniref:Uncharacterized protein n=1 Tax=Favolaschia claudopus TaxID=2862362 RepID=A0AAW0EJR6_9AGAR
MAANAALPDVEPRRTDATNGHTVIEVVHGDNLNLSHKETTPPSEEYPRHDTADEQDTCSSSGDDISIHVESASDAHDHDQSLSSSVLTAQLEADPDHDASEPPTEDLSASATLRNSRVRFRSPRTHHLWTAPLSSPSSSISAPLRSPLTEDTCSPGWGPLGQRVNLLVSAAEARNGKRRLPRRRLSGGAPNERTALLGEPPPPGYNPESDSDVEYYSDEDSPVDGEALLSHQIDLVFGKWPARLLNRQWWWWQLQPIICCSCLDEPDTSY